MYKNNPVNVALTDQELAQQESSISQDDLVKVEGTKVQSSKDMIQTIWCMHLQRLIQTGTIAHACNLTEHAFDFMLCVLYAGAA